MKHISELKGIGIGEMCCIIGGGPSAGTFNFFNIPDDMVRIELNYPHVPIRIDYQMYYDEGPNKYWEDNKLQYGRVTIGFKNWAKTADYYYEFKDFDFGDMGYHALQFADKIFNFSKIYLIGYDYKAKGQSYHWWEDSSDSTARERFISHSIGKVLPKYYTYEWQNKIYNCNSNSGLTAFEYKPIEEEL